MQQVTEATTKQHSIPWVKVLLVAIFASLQAQLWFGEGSLGELKRIEAALEKQQAANKLLLARNAQLQAQVERLRVDPQALEARARSELDLVRPNETLYRIVIPTVKASDDDQP